MIVDQSSSPHCFLMSNSCNKNGVAYKKTCTLKNKYGNNSRLLFTDTDILMYENKTDDVYEYFSNNKEMLDFSNLLN